MPYLNIRESFIKTQNLKESIKQLSEEDPMPGQVNDYQKSKFAIKQKTLEEE